MLLSKLASLCSDAIHAKLIATMALHDKALLKTAWEINCLKVVYFLSLEEDMIKCNESILFSKLVFYLPSDSVSLSLTAHTMFVVLFQG